MPNPLQREETEYFYDETLDDLYPGTLQRKPTPSQTQYIYDESLDDLYLGTAPATQYHFDPISTQGLQRVNEIEQQGIAEIMETTHSSPPDRAALVEEEEVNPDVLQGPEEAKDAEEPMVHYLPPVGNYGDLNNQVLAIISKAGVACIRGHFQSEQASWSTETCFAQLGIKPQIHVTSYDSGFTII